MFADSSSRVKRAAAPDGWSTCRMIAVADYKFYRFIGDRSIYTAANYIVSQLFDADVVLEGWSWYTFLAFAAREREKEREREREKESIFGLHMYWYVSYQAGRQTDSMHACTHMNAF